MHETLCDSFGAFPLCEPCWESLSIQERIPYYEQHIALWYESTGNQSPERQAQLDAKAQALREAVLAGG